jgi:hypothetical protein
MATDYGTFTSGGVIYPLTPSTANSALRDIDPGSYYLLDYLSAMLVRHVGARFAAEATKSSLKGVDGHIVTNIVTSKVAYDPTQYLAQNQVRFPLFAIYRDNDLFSEKSATYRRVATSVNVLYVLPPLTPSQAERLTPLLHGISTVIFERLEEGSDPSYTPPGGTIGQRVGELGGWDMVGLANGRYTGFSAGETLYFPAWQGTINLVERAGWVSSAFQEYSGADVHIDLRDDPTNTTILDVVQFASDVG